MIMDYSVVQRRCALALPIMAVALITGSELRAEYIRTSSVGATICKGFIVRRCSTNNTIQAISDGRDGRLFEFAETFDRVDEFRNGRCYLYNAYRWYDPEYHAHRSTPEGVWQHLGVPDSFSFDCFKR
ncbi:hypothetical protein [Pseudooceanicola atlanticus]|uniref:hypothetical protein n=1 Tax=Pseudooceanicola atlanticus TaxID=1461694 RepID=UPI0023562436|nr:hypothetical protein [Pseudooceanicola atlanticus]